MKIRFRNPEVTGIIKDIPAHKLPPEAWSDGSNVRFYDGVVGKILGYSQVFDDTNPTSEAAAYYLQYYPQNESYFWVLCGLDDCWTYSSGGAYSERTPVAGDFTGDADDIWTGGILSGISLINNGVESPHKLDIAGGDTKYTVLKWDATHDWDDIDGLTTPYTCKVLRTYKSYGIALNIDQDGTRYPFRVRWSHPAESGEEPSSWDETDDTKDAGWVDLDDTGDYLVDCHPLRDENIIYKEDSTWIQRAVGAGQIMSHRKLFSSSGLMAPRCVREYNGLHIVKSMDDWVVHDGQRIVHRIVDRKWRKWLLNNIDGSNYNRSFIVPKYAEDQFWFCFPSTGATYANTALIWNHQTNALDVRDLPGATHMELGVVQPNIDDTFGNSTLQINTQTGPFDIRYYNPIQREILMSEYNASEMRLHIMGSTNQNNGSNMTAYIEREDLPLTEGLVDACMHDRLLRVVPYILGTLGGVIEIKIGTKDDLNDSITWGTAQNFIIGTTQWLDFRHTARYLSIDFRSTTNIQWEMSGYDLEVSPESKK